MSFDRFLISKFFAFSPAVAREISFLASGSTETFVSELNFTRAWESFSSVISRIREKEYAPCAVYNGDKGVEYAYLPLNQYSGMTLKLMPAIIFLVASFLAFSMGTSWGTFGILIPIVVIIFNGEMSTLLVISLAATLAGSVFGDHVGGIAEP